jgi:hypothetical protein
MAEEKMMCKKRVRKGVRKGVSVTSVLRSTGEERSSEDRPREQV